MNLPKSSDDVMWELNDLAKSEGRHLDQCFWEIPRPPGSLLDVPVTPEVEERIRRLDEKIAELRSRKNTQNGNVACPSDSVKKVTD